jgi:tetratricopeptide (TPR) repeat protein
LLDERPAWLSAPNSIGVMLGPLSNAESEALLEEISSEWPLSQADRARIAEAAEGNPLYVEQMAAMVAEGGPADAIPPSIHALLAARLDRLPGAERELLERAAVAGKEFARSAVLQLSPEAERAEVDARMLSLVRKELLAARPGREDAYRFRHVLIRDAAYAGIPKEVRAQLHARFANWAANTAAGRFGELDEIVGYHFEQSFRYREQLGPVDDEGHELAREGAEILAGAGRRALRRGDIPAAANLLERASLLGPEDALGRQLLLDLGRTFREAGRLAEAEATFVEAKRRADEASDRLLGCQLMLEEALLHAYTYPERGTEELVRTADSVIPAFQELGHDAGLALAWLLIAEAHWLQCRIGPMEEALAKAHSHAGAEPGRERVEIWNGLARAALAGPLPVPEAIARCREIAAEAPPDRALEAVLATVSALLEAMRGRFDIARELYASSQATLADLGQTVSLAALQTWSGAVELLAGDPAAAEAELRAAFDTFEPMGEKANLATIAASLAGVLSVQGRDQEAVDLTTLSENLASHDDLTSQIEWRAVRAQVFARQGQHDEAESLAGEAVALAEQTDCPKLRGDALISLGDALSSADDVVGAGIAFAGARDQYQAKGNTVMAGAAGKRIAALADRSLEGVARPNPGRSSRR